MLHAVIGFSLISITILMGQVIGIGETEFKKFKISVVKGSVFRAGTFTGIGLISIIAL